jgi:multidrug efflux pump subunit AcrB
MRALGLSLDNVSLLGITLAVGLVVDDAVVMLENIVRHVEEGMEPFAAAIKGAKEMAFTIFSISISLVAVFIPIFFMPGVIGGPVPRIRHRGLARHRRVGDRVPHAGADAGEPLPAP